MLKLKHIRLAAVILAILLSASFFSACSGNKNSVIVAGSTSVMPYAETLAEEFMRLNPEIHVAVRGGGSSAGITGVREGICDIGMSSRELKDNDDERDLLREEIALDALAVIVHPSNPVSNLTVEQLRKIYTGEIADWKDVGGKNAKIYVVTRESGSGTRSAFEELVMNKERISSKAIVKTANCTIRHYVSGSKNAIGFVSLGLVATKKGQKDVTPLRLDGYEATEENIVLHKTYGLVRSFWFVSLREPEGAAKEFWDFAVSEAGREILKSKGLIVKGSADEEF